MRNEIQAVFREIHAEEELKNRTLAFISEKTHVFSGKGTRKGLRLAVASVCACLVLMVLGGVWLFFSPVCAISIDINPSLELGVNRFERVVSVTGFNEDGEKLSNSLNLKYRSYTDAIEEILEEDTVVPLLGDGELVITVVGEEEEKSSDMLAEIESCAAKHANAHCAIASSEECAPAHEEGFSCGKYKAYLELKELDLEITAEEVQGMTMREIRDRIALLTEKSEAEPASGVKTVSGAEPETQENVGNEHHGNGAHNGSGSGHHGRQNGNGAGDGNGKRKRGNG